MFGKVLGGLEKLAGAVAPLAPLNPYIGMASAGLGALYQNREAKKSAATAMDYQTQMSNTSYQRQMADLKAAGLNPLLAGKMGGASTPSGVSYQPVNIGAAGPQAAAQLASAKQSMAQSEKIAVDAEAVTQTTEFNEVLHNERWSKLFASMGPDNVLASVMAVLNGVDIQDVLQGRAISVTQEENLRGFLEMAQENRSYIRTELQGVEQKAGEYGRFFAELFNEFMKGK